LYNFSEKQKEVSSIWYLFSGKEKRNMLIYIIGLMLYKFGLEAFNGSIVSLAANRYDRDASNSGTSARTFEKVGLIVGLNQACQCIGSILIAPLTKRWPTKTVLSVSIFLFALFTALLMIIDASTGGKIKPSNFYPMHEHDYSYYGNYPTSVIIPIYCITGIAYGMVELIRRIIPQEIVGSDEEKLQRMDALVHVFYEIAGVSGALITGLILIPRLGNNYAFIVTPILFSLSAVVWFFIRLFISNDEIPGENEHVKTNYLKALITGFYLFFESVYLGGKIIFTNRKYFWLFPCYSLTLYVHRYIENGIAPQIAKRYLGHSEWSQIIVGGSNFGELCGALSVFFLTKKIHSPIVWLRLDCLLLFIVWYIPFYNPSSISVTNAWIIALSFIPFGFGGAGDDVSLNAHIQSSLSQPQLKNKDVSTLSSVMAFLYSSYIILYAILNPLLGKYIDSVYNTNQTIRPAFIFTVGVQISIISVVVAISTFIPRASFKLNPSCE
jgi:MFS family permease